MISMKPVTGENNCFMSFDDLALLRKLIIDVHETVVIMSKILELATKILTIREEEA